MVKIICVCLYNACRSPIIERVLKKNLEERGKKEIVESAGLVEAAREGSPASDKSIIAMKNIGIDISGHRSRYLGDLDWKDATYFVVPREKEKKKLKELFLGKGYNSQILVVAQDKGGLPGAMKSDGVTFQDQGVYNKMVDMTSEWIGLYSDLICP